jgi:hypothetical protein
MMYGGVSKPSTRHPVSSLMLSERGPRACFIPLPRSQLSARARSARATSSSSIVSRKPKNPTPSP